MSTAVDWYNQHAKTLAVQYEAVDPARLHAGIADLLPQGQGAVLDVGAGTGRDAAWLATRGLDVVAVEPSRAMRDEAARMHTDPRIQWVGDCLPDFNVVSRLGLSFDFILLSAVWMHIAPNDRSRAFRKLVTLLKPGGVLAISLRFGPAAADRGMHPVSAQEIEHLAKAHGAFVERQSAKADEQGRADVSWVQMVIRLPDDGTGALPLLRHLTINDGKSSTYKLALLRTLCRMADSATGLARVEGDQVRLPFGLVALYWIRLYKPLLAAGLPQAPGNRSLEGLGFVKAGFRKLMEQGSSVSHLDMRMGMSFEGERARALHEALRDACATIEQMPVRYLTYPDGKSILQVQRLGRVTRPATLTLDVAYLWSFGEMTIPSFLWQALQRFDVWIEPALVAEWTRLMKLYAKGQGVPKLSEANIVAALDWPDPKRDVGDAKRQALRLIEGPGLHCVWTGSRLSAANMDIDHCLPWVAWPCSDLWNLMPALRSVNQHKKRERLPGESVLHAARDRIQTWWQEAYLGQGNAVLPTRFRTEAVASLPIVGGTVDGTDEVFSGLALQRLRLKLNRQVPEWQG